MKDLYRAIFLRSIRIPISYFNSILHNLYVENAVPDFFFFFGKTRKLFKQASRTKDLTDPVP